MNHEENATMKNSPFFSGKRDEYESWLKRLAMWLHTADVDKKVVAKIVAQRTAGRAWDVAQDIDLDILSNGDMTTPPEGLESLKEVTKGIHALISALNASGFRERKGTLAMTYLMDFIDFRRPPNMSMADFCWEFCQRYDRAGRSGKLKIDDESLVRLMLSRCTMEPEDLVKVLSLTKTTLKMEDAIKDIDHIFPPIVPDKAGTMEKAFAAGKCSYAGKTRPQEQHRAGHMAMARPTRGEHLVPRTDDSLGGTRANSTKAWDPATCVMSSGTS